MSHHIGRQRWRDLYLAAISESDPHTLDELAANAQKAIQERARELWYRNSGAVAEHQELHAAVSYLANLRVLARQSSQFVTGHHSKNVRT